MSRPMRTTAGAVDFAKLYAELGIAPDCGLDRFKQAYRRRVAELHPDRPGTGGRNPDVLVALNLGYAAVLDFHRGHGRLPGAPAAGAPAAVLPGTPAVDTPSAGTRPVGPSSAQLQAAGIPAPRVPGLRLLTLPVLLLVLAAWLWLPGAQAPLATTEVPPPARAQAAPAAPGEAQLGMDRGTVAALVGEPVARSGDDSRWIYGPSWLHFECDRLADWYSSPLRPLRVGSRTPDARDIARRHRRVAACPRPADIGRHHAKAKA